MTATPQPYDVPANDVEVELVVKKSRFITRAGRAQDRTQALAMVERARKDYPDARHHCWAYKLGSPHSPSSAAMSDDGEPSGTAGKPMLNVLNHKDIGEIAVVVIRYFGGIKLGAGGLVRAYSEATQLAVTELELQPVVPTVELRVALPFDREQRLRHWLSSHDGQIGEIHYSDKVTLLISLPHASAAALKQWLDGEKGASLLPED